MGRGHSPLCTLLFFTHLKHADQGSFLRSADRRKERGPPRYPAAFQALLARTGRAGAGRVTARFHAFFVVRVLVRVSVGLSVSLGAADVARRFLDHCRCARSSVCAWPPTVPTSIPISKAQVTSRRRSATVPSCACVLLPRAAHHRALLLSSCGLRSPFEVRAPCDSVRARIASRARRTLSPCCLTRTSSCTA